MSAPLACVVCSLDPQTSSLILPIAQATIVAAPVILRDQIRRGARVLLDRRSSRRAARRAAAGPANAAGGPRGGAEGER